jgi:hypothetical protein
MLYKTFMAVLSLFNPKSWFNEKVWVNPELLGVRRKGFRLWGYGKSQYLPVGAQVFDNKGRLCVVVKQGKNGALRRLSHQKTEATVAGWSFRKLAKVHFLWTRTFISIRAKLLGPSLRYHWMTSKFRAVIMLFRLNRRIRALLKSCMVPR